MNFIDNLLKVSSRLIGFMIWSINYMLQPSEKDTVEIEPLINNIINTDYTQTIKVIEDYRSALLHHNHLKLDKKAAIDIALRKRMISSASPPLNAIILRHICTFAKAKKVLELGTSAGISSAYMAHESDLHLDTIDMDEKLSIIAESNHKIIGINNINYIRNKFEYALPSLLKDGNQYDVIYIDGDHSFKGTMKNFNMLVSACSSNGIIILDDINWSWGMQKAWKNIKKDPRIKWSMDLYHMGVVGINCGSIKNIRLCMIPKLWISWLSRRIIN